MTPHDFLDRLWKYKPEEMYVLLWTWPDKRSHWFQDLGQAGEFAASTGQTHDVYVGVGLSAGSIVMTTLLLDQPTVGVNTFQL